MRPAFLLLRYHLFYIEIFYFSVYWLDGESLFSVWRDRRDSIRRFLLAQKIYKSEVNSDYNSDCYLLHTLRFFQPNGEILFDSLKSLCIQATHSHRRTCLPCPLPHLFHHLSILQRQAKGSASPFAGLKKQSLRLL